LSMLSIEEAIDKVVQFGSFIKIQLNLVLSVQPALLL
jgi:hypothetical protein